ncbi:phage tail sheath family protein [Subsaximicrobium wynnwilliamsii]|uniref:Phage tail sheath family protein n=2 Tax=Subsaximicrobium wynnwilliamsii TaxID=291179 RepID=A0A5C6ZF42_9FLAO|nr:phage tail sheath family protein [Subsaximicrobium wynnwilliamsii]TXD87381.1 phage tail sheath family protein [Subsaximicrobium wynnwilliamsii]TXE03305.1 phage tail sheath family protein [Subsaximicrobium wynnwilliamsii]
MVAMTAILFPWGLMGELKISVGTYGGVKVIPDFSIAQFLKGLGVVETISEITLIAIPDAVFLESSDCFQLQEAMVAQCEKLQNRFAILDVYSGNESIASSANPIKNFRTQLNARALNYAAAYYPWLHTGLKSHTDVDFTNLNERSKVLLRQICEQFISKNFNASEAKAIKPYLDCIAKPMQSIPTISVQQLLTSEEAHKKLNQIIPDYKQIMLALLKQENLMPPSAAMAGVYTVMDKTRGVWKAPANVGVVGVVAASVRIDSQQNQALNVDVSGKSINAIREFPNRGIRVWGARTLDTNLLETRYINTSRTLISIKQSVKCALKPFAFEPNDQNTWQRINGMVENYLNTFWREGALAGLKVEQAYFVTIGLNRTMSQQDINAGLLKLELGVSFTRPAEFSVIRIVQKMGAN